MKDIDIRKILLEYIKVTTHNDATIYEEKNIGSSICDVMVVFDELIGYEIKSDNDTYARLNRQVKAYDMIFDRNYIVISASHRKSIEHNVPEFWGILVVENNAITKIREAKVVPQFFEKTRVKRQLDILWELELRNILTRHSLPCCVYKSRDFIINKLVMSVELDVLKRDILYELRNRDNPNEMPEISIDDIDYSIRSRIPIRDIVDTLSEVNLDKFSLDQWIMIYRNAMDIKDRKAKVITENYQRKEHDVKIDDIEFRLGAPWISNALINDFDYYLRYGQPVDEDEYYPNYVNYEPITGNWSIVDKKNGDYNRLCNLYGIEEYNAINILEATLNLRDIKVYKEYHVFDEEKTMVALEKQVEMQELFRAWILEDSDRIWEIEEAYNNAFGEYKPMHMDGSKLVFPEMSKDIKLYPFQKDAIKRIVSEKNTLLAHDVGAGKTYTMIGAAMLKRQMGISRKNMFVVPNSIVGQWELMFRTMYPNSKVLAISPSNYRKGLREKVLIQIRDGDYDGIIVAYSCFEMMPLSKQKILGITEEEIRKLNDVNEEDFCAVKNREINYIRRLINYLDYSIEKASMKVTFEDLGITGLYVDEAHNFKNIPIRTALQGVTGINAKGSNKCYEMLLKVRTVQREVNGGVVFATGTPICNSITDVYNIQMYLQPEDLERTHLDRFDNWIKTFAMVESVSEVDVDTSKFRVVDKISKFYNLPELSRMFSKIADFHAVTGNGDLPINDGYNDVVIRAGTQLKEYMKSLSERTELIRSYEVTSKQDNMLKVSTDGRKAALDLRLVGCEQQYDKTSKIYRCVQRVMGIYKRYSGCTQIIFCDYSTPKSNAFNVYDELKRQLVSKGVPDGEIAFIHDYIREVDKVKLFAKFNEGKVRILIGSTFKLGIGSNVQVRLKAIHHLDVPWRPSDMVQREGRIIRKGNKNKHINIYRYLSKGSFDAYAWQILETKQRFISQFLSGTAYQRSIEDLENNVLNYAEVKALTIGNRNMKMLFEKQNELDKYRMLSRNAAERAEKNRLMAIDARATIQRLNRYVDATKENISYLANVGQIRLRDEVDKLCSILSDEFLSADSSNDTMLLEFKVLLPEKQNEKKPFILLSRNGMNYEVRLGSSITGNRTRILNVLLHLDKQIMSYENEIEQCKTRIEDYENALNNPNTYEGRVFELEHDIAALHNKLLDDYDVGYTLEGDLVIIR